MLFPETFLVAFLFCYTILLLDRYKTLFFSGEMKGLQLSKGYKMHFVATPLKNLSLGICVPGEGGALTYTQL